MIDFKRIVKVIIYPFLFILLGISLLVKRNNNVWVFGSYSDLFNDNSKYLFIHINGKHPEIKSVWISGNKETIKEVKSKGFKAHYRWGFHGVFYSLIGSIYFYNSYVSDINSWLFGKALKVNLWHGVPMKKIEFDITKGPIKSIFDGSLSSRFFHMPHYVKPDYVLSTSDVVSKFFSSAFRVDFSKCLPFGYPRNDFFYKTEDEMVSFLNDFKYHQELELISKLRSFSKVYVYMPTWRDDNSDFIKASGLDFYKLNEVLKSTGSCCIIKLHTNTVSNIDVNINEFENLIFLSSSVDIYSLLAFTDVLVTDYSSIFFDYKLMGKEIVLFCFDLDPYLKSREMYFDYKYIEDDAFVIRDFSGLLEFIENDKYEKKPGNQFVNSMIGSNSNGESSEEIFMYFKNILKI